MGTPTCRWGSLALSCKGLVRINISCRMVGETHAQNDRQVRFAYLGSPAGIGPHCTLAWLKGPTNPRP